MLLRLQVWNLCATGTQIMRAADCKPFVGKTRRVFPTGSKSPLANCQRAFSCLNLQHFHEVERNDQAGKHDGDRGAELDQDVQGRAGSILERVADGIANDSCLVLGAALAAVVAALDILLRVVPCAARVGHEHSHRKAGDGHAAEQTDNARGSKNKAGDDRDDDGQQRRCTG